MKRKYTNNDKEVRAWAQRHSAHPVERAPFVPDSEPTQLGFVFGEVPKEQESLRPIEWATFFALFHLSGLVLAYGDDMSYELLKAEGESSEWFEGKPLRA
jgi:hypothetical protein